MLPELFEQDISWLLCATQFPVLALALLVQLALMCVPVKDKQAVLLVGVCQVVLLLFSMWMLPDWTALSLWCTLVSLARVFSFSMRWTVFAASFALWVQTQLPPSMVVNADSVSVFSWLGMCVGLVLLTRTWRNPLVLMSAVAAAFELLNSQGLPGHTVLGLWIMCLCGGMIHAVRLIVKDHKQGLVNIVFGVSIIIVTLQPVNLRVSLPWAYIDDLATQAELSDIAIVHEDELSIANALSNVYSVASDSLLVSPTDTLLVRNMGHARIFVSARAGISRQELPAPIFHTQSGWVLNDSILAEGRIERFHAIWHNVVVDSTYRNPLNRHPLNHVVVELANVLSMSWKQKNDSAFASLLETLDTEIIVLSALPESYSHIIRIGELLYLAGETSLLSELLQVATAQAHRNELAMVAYRIALLQSRQAGQNYVVQHVHKGRQEWTIAMHEQELSVYADQEQLQDALRYAHLLRHVYEISQIEGDTFNNTHVPDWNVVFRQLHAKVHNTKRF